MKFPIPWFFNSYLVVGHHGSYESIWLILLVRLHYVTISFFCDTRYVFVLNRDSYLEAVIFERKRESV
jgi:hypothetical protein